MNNITKLAIIIGLLLFTCSFSHGGNRALADKVMEIHDIAMAKMTHMHELKLQLKDVAAKNGSTPEIDSAINNLSQAHKKMMMWMREYKAPKSEDELTTAKPYLLEEKTKIQAVSDAINSSIAEAEQLLQ